MNRPLWSLRRSKYETSTWPFGVTAIQGWNWSASPVLMSWFTRTGPVYVLPPSVDLKRTMSAPEPGLPVVSPAAPSSRGSFTCGCLGLCSSWPPTAGAPSAFWDATATYTLPLPSTALVGMERFRNSCPGNWSFTPVIEAIGRAGVNVCPRSVDFTCMIESSWLSYQVT